MSARPKTGGKLRSVFEDPGAFSALLLPDVAMRSYQVEPARLIAEAVRRRAGEGFAVVFSRQAGKDELLAQLVAYLLSVYRKRGGSIVVAAPTRNPQAAITQRRVIARLKASPVTAGFKAREHVISLGQAEAAFLSAGRDAGARGHTASLLLVANEAQDIDPDRWDAVFEPMGASTNSVSLFMGTVWDNTGLLHRQMSHFQGLQAADGRPRVFLVPWTRVEADVPAYGARVRSRIAQLGESHPFIRTEYELVALDSEAGLFPPARQAQMRGEHPRRHEAEPGKTYALLVDVAGEEEEGGGPESFINDTRRDSTALTVVEVVRTARELPDYRVVERLAWTGKRHTALYEQLLDLARNVWKARAVVIDATGVGAGLASFLVDKLRKGPRPVIVEPFTFTGKSKSDLGWAFLGLIDGGRFKEYAGESDEITRVYWHQLAAARYEVLPGPNRLLRWSVPVSSGHDDLLISAALTAQLDVIDWRDRAARGS